MKFNSQIATTVEQSKRLLELGLKPETADCQYAALVVDWKGNPISNPKWRFYDHNKGFIVQNFEHMECSPAWSLHRLIELCPETIEGIYNDNEAHCSLHIDFNKHRNIYNNIIDYIDWLIKKGYFNKEYLR